MTKSVTCRVICANCFKPTEINILKGLKKDDMTIHTCNLCHKVILCVAEDEE